MAVAARTDRSALLARLKDLKVESETARQTSSRIGLLAAVEKYKESSSVQDLIGGATGAAMRADTHIQLSGCLARLGDLPAAARAICVSLQAARASGSRTKIVFGLVACAGLAKNAPNEMVTAEKESREQERLSGPPPSYGSLDLSQEGRISLPTTPAALSRLSLAYNEAAVEICDAALAAAGGRDSPAAADARRVPNLFTEASARSSLGTCLHNLGNLDEERLRGVEIVLQSVALLRQLLRLLRTGCVESLNAKYALASTLCNLACHPLPGDDGMAQNEVCLREALELSEELEDVQLKQKVLGGLANMSWRTGQRVGPTEAAALRSRMNALYAHNGRTTDMNCTICFEPLELLEQPGGGADEGDDGDGHRPSGLTRDSAVRVLGCGHQFHYGCLATWRRTISNTACPICKK